MKQKKIWIIASIAITVVIFASLYFLHISKPTEFLSHDVLIEKINSYYYGGDSVEIQDVVILNERYVLVPFISSGRYGTSYWIWRDRSWRLSGINTIQQPVIWKVDPKDPSTYVILWNMDPNNALTNFDIYLYNRRGYSVRDNVHQYTPKVQLHSNVRFDGEKSSYGVIQLPQDWITFLEDYVHVKQSKKTSNSLFSNFIQPSSINFGWIPLNDHGDVTNLLPHKGSGRGFSNIEYMLYIQEDELE